jgi:hypothetical protein
MHAEKDIMDNPTSGIAIEKHEKEHSKPYSRNPTHETNLKPRAIHCFNCDYTVVSDVAGPVCGECGQDMITIFNEQLVNGNRQGT